MVDAEGEMGDIFDGRLSRVDVEKEFLIGSEMPGGCFLVARDTNQLEKSVSALDLEDEDIARLEAL